MLETQISPIFGLTLIQLVEVISIISILIAVATVISLYISTTRRSKTQSADISLRLLEMGRTDQFKKIYNKINKKEKLEQQEIKDILRYYEYVGEFFKDGVISHDHVLHIHGMNLKKIYETKEIRDVFTESRKNRSNYNYVNLYNMFLKINEDLEFDHNPAS